MGKTLRRLILIYMYTSKDTLILSVIYSTIIYGVQPSFSHTWSQMMPTDLQCSDNVLETFPKRQLDVTVIRQGWLGECLGDKPVAVMVLRTLGDGRSFLLLGLGLGLGLGVGLGLGLGLGLGWGRGL
jgi:hypothetical protein